MSDMKIEMERKPIAKELEKIERHLREAEDVVKKDKEVSPGVKKEISNLSEEITKFEKQERDIVVPFQRKISDLESEMERAAKYSRKKASEAEQKKQEKEIILMEHKWNVRMRNRLTGLTEVLRLLSQGYYIVRVKRTFSESFTLGESKDAGNYFPQGYHIRWMDASSRGLFIFTDLKKADPLANRHSDGASLDVNPRPRKIADLKDDVDVYLCKTIPVAEHRGCGHQVSSCPTCKGESIAYGLCPVCFSAIYFECEKNERHKTIKDCPRCKRPADQYSGPLPREVFGPGKPLPSNMVLVKIRGDDE